jgi:hypothetical protein
MKADASNRAAGQGTPSGEPGPSVELRPRWVWILFALVALAIPLIGFLIERGR